MTLLRRHGIRIHLGQGITGRRRELRLIHEERGVGLFFQQIAILRMHGQARLSDSIRLCRIPVQARSGRKLSSGDGKRLAWAENFLRDRGTMALLVAALMPAPSSSTVRRK